MAVVQHLVRTDGVEAQVLHRVQHRWVCALRLRRLVQPYQRGDRGGQRAGVGGTQDGVAVQPARAASRGINV